MTTSSISLKKETEDLRKWRDLPGSTSWSAQVRMPQSYLGVRIKEPQWGRKGTGSVGELQGAGEGNMIWYWVREKDCNPLVTPEDSGLKDFRWNSLHLREETCRATPSEERWGLSLNWQMQIFAPDQWSEAPDSCGWIWRKMEEAEEEDYSVEYQKSQLTWTLEISQILEHQPESIHQLIWSPQHIYSRGIPNLGLVREDVPNPQETWGPREFRFLVCLCVEHPPGDRQAERCYGMWSSWKVEQ